MKPYIHRPNPPLSQWIELMLHSDGASVERETLLILPSGVMQMIVNLRDDRFPRTIISGPFFRPFLHDTAQQQSVLLVRFRPGGAAPFLGLPATELQNQGVSLEEVWGTQARELRDRLVEAQSPEIRFKILEEALLARARQTIDRTVEYAIKSIAAAPAQRVKELIQASGRSERQFQRIFSASVGLSPKQYQRVRRFQGVLALLERARHPDWLDIAFDAGYFDQAHLIHEFTELSGMTPTEYLTRKGKYLNHVPVRAEESRPARR